MTTAGGYFSGSFGSHVREFIYLPCPTCGNTEGLEPGVLSADRTIEYRRCVNDHVVETEPYFVTRTSDSTRFA